MTDGTRLTGLEGTNPLGFLAALGVQVLFEHDEHQPMLWWSDDVVPHAIVSEDFSVDHIMNTAMRAFSQWLESPALNPGFGHKGDNDAKFKKDEIRDYLARSQPDQPGGRLASALVAEGSLDGSGKVAKPTDLYFTAGQLKFLKIVRDVLSGVNSQHLENCLLGPWDYPSRLSSLGWDITDDRTYALAPSNPAKDKKFSNPGVEALAILGLSRHPVYASQDVRGRDRTLTLGCSGPWRRGGTYSWTIWTRPASLYAVRSLLMQTSGSDDYISKRHRWYAAWGISHILRSVIRRSDQGGYGTFRPPQIVWSRT